MGVVANSWGGNYHTPNGTDVLIADGAAGHGVVSCSSQHDGVIPYGSTGPYWGVDHGTHDPNGMWIGTPYDGFDGSSGPLTPNITDITNPLEPHLLTSDGTDLVIGPGGDAATIIIQNPPLFIPNAVPPQDDPEEPVVEEKKPRPKRIGGFGKTGVRKFKKPE